MFLFPYPEQPRPKPGFSLMGGAGHFRLDPLIFRRYAQFSNKTPFPSPKSFHTSVLIKLPFFLSVQPAWKAFEREGGRNLGASDAPGIPSPFPFKSSPRTLAIQYQHGKAIIFLRLRSLFSWQLLAFWCNKIWIPELSERSFEVKSGVT